MTHPAATVADYLASEIIRRKELRDRVEKLAEQMPKQLAKTKWWLLSVAAIAAACSLAAFMTLQTSWQMGQRPEPCADARTTLLDAQKLQKARLAAAARLTDISALNVETLWLAAAEKDPEVSASAIRSLADLRQRLVAK